MSHIYSFLLEKLITNMFDSLKPIRKETAALKIKAAVSNRRIDRLLYDGFFSFAVVRQIASIFGWSIVIRR